MTEVPPLFVIEFLHRVADTFEDYFNDITETTIKDNYVVVYELLDEMLDNGFPLATESNILKELIKPPNILRTVVNTVTGKTNMSETLPTGQVRTLTHALHMSHRLFFVTLLRQKLGSIFAPKKPSFQNL